MIRSNSVWTRLGPHVVVFSAMVSWLAVSIHAAPLDVLGVPEQADWSDFAFPGGVTGGFDLGTLELTVSASPSNDLELGEEFFNDGKHYGTGGTIGSAFSATLSVSGVEILPDGTIQNGGTVSVVFNGGAPGSIGTDYGVGAGGVLLEGTVIGVLMDATGDDTLDVAYEITGGALQNPNPELGPDPVVFAANNVGLIRIGGSITLPADFSSSFSIDGGTINNFGIPEPTTLAMAVMSGLVLVCRKRRA